MNNFGFISSLLPVESSWDFFADILPEKWRYRGGPLLTGTLTGYLEGEKLEGFGWKVPEDTAGLWNESRLIKLWRRLTVELTRKEIGIIGLDSATTFDPPFKIINQQYFPDISDGKALELLLFLNYFRNVLRNYRISPQKAKVAIIWEEGNLGLTCARLIAREIRFLSLVNPNIRFLERAADLIIAETGISPKLYTEPPEFNKEKIVVKCGKLTRLCITRHSKQVIWCEIFQKKPSLSCLNINLPITVTNRRHRIPLYPALGEAILRSFFNLPGFWYGSDLQLERIVKLADLFKELRINIAI